MIVMHYSFLRCVVTVLALCTWKYEKMDHDEIKPFVQKRSQKEEKKEGNVLMEQKDAEKQTDKPPLGEDSTKLNLKDELMFIPAFSSVSGSVPLETVFVLLLIHTCGADAVASISTVTCHSCLVVGLIDLAVFVIYKWRRDNSELKKDARLQDEKTELLKENAQLQEELVQKVRAQEDVVSTLMEVKAELEKQRGQLHVQLDEVETGREENKQKLQSVEKELTERAVTFDKPEELLRDKENLSGPVETGPDKEIS